MTTTKLPFGLKQYIISSTEILLNNKIEQRMIKAKLKEQAWSKFTTQYFGALKPCPSDWIIQEVNL